MGRSKEDKPRKSEKIRPFEITEEMATDDLMDKMIREELIKEADQIEEELESKEELKGIKAPDWMYEELVARLKREGLWGESEEKKDEKEEKEEAPVEEKEEEKEEIPVEEKDEENEGIEKEIEAEKEMEEAGEEREEVYEWLSEEDREALRIGREILMGKEGDKGKKKRGWKRNWGKVAVAVLALVCVGGVSVSSEAGKGYFQKVWTFISGGELSINIDGNDSNIRSLSEEEEEMNKRVQDELDIIPIKLLYTPENMVFEKYKIDLSDHACYAIYEINDNLVNIQMYKDQDTDSRIQKFDGKLLDKIMIESQKLEVPIWKIENPNNEVLYATQFGFGGSYYSISGAVSEEEFIKIIQNINF
ncbi:MAG: DUF4367 domain-containing protein [Eubacteriales bacterium]|nr:DUF4367 domain-containing protein [Eubacteriales bacterium]